MRLHFIHIGKTGGTALKRALRSRQLAYWADRDDEGAVHATRYGPIQLHHHGFTLDDVAPDDRAFFCMRDPIERFVSAFYSRLNKGQPRYYFEWTKAERRAFEAFPTPQQLAGALAGEDAAQRKLARWSMRKIRHMGPAWEIVGSPAQLRTRLDRVVYIARQETLATDWEQLKDLLGLPEDATLPSSPTFAHRRDRSHDATLDPTAIAALREWYRVDYRLLWYCDTLRALRAWGEGSPPPGPRRVVHEVRRVRGVPALLPPLPAWIGNRISVG